MLKFHDDFLVENKHSEAISIMFLACVFKKFRLCSNIL